MDYSDYDTSELEILQDSLIEEIQELHQQIEEKSYILECVVEELGYRFDDCGD